MEATSAASFHVAPKARRASRPCPALRWHRSATTQHVAAEASVAFTPGQKGSKRCAPGCACLTALLLNLLGEVQSLLPLLLA